MNWSASVRRTLLLPGVVMMLAAAACGPRAPACPTPSDGKRFLSAEEFATALAATPAPPSSAEEVDLGRMKIVADKVVSGPLCNDSWRGTVYVTCDARVAAWTDSKAPEFLKGCNLEIEPGTVVYVGAHYNTAYYEGCSCHTGEIGGR
jgi:hypothetical protein